MSDNLGAATGRIVIDTSSLQSARAASQTAGRDIQRNLSGIGTGAQNLTGALRNVAGAFGITFGAAAIAQIGRFIAEQDKVATAYNRQLVAARNLAGSAAQLNDLLSAYEKATGGAVDRGTALADVTRLQAVGFADSAAELEKFVTAARGISVATGQQQDYVISQLQLAIANQSTMRLDQLGLGVAEVKQRIDDLRSANSNLTEEMAYQQAILGLADEKFGDLTRSTAGQATGAERLAKAWRDMRLEMGREIAPPTNAIQNWIANAMEALRLARELDRTAKGIQEFRTGISTYDPRYAGGSGISDMVRGNTRIRQPDPNEITKEQENVIVEWSRARSRIEKEAYEQSVETTAQYGQQRAQTIARYEQSIAREARDFATQRAQAEQDHAAAIGDIREAAARREQQLAENLARTIARAQSDAAARLADLQEDLDRTLAQRRADSAERVADWEEDREAAVEERRKASAERILKMEEDFAEARERAQAEFQLSLEEAAARGDGRAVYQLQRRYEQEQQASQKAHDEQLADERKALDQAVRQINEAHQERLQDEKRSLDKGNKQAQEAHARQVADLQEALAQQIADAQAAYQEQLEAGRTADAERILDMEAAFAERKRREDADRATRLRDLATDHSNQLSEMDRTHALRLAQISRHAGEERAKVDEEFTESLAALGKQIDGYKEAHEQMVDFAIEEFNRWLKAVREGLATGPQPSPIENPSLDPRREQLLAKRLELQQEQAGLIGPEDPRWREIDQEIAALEEALKKLGWVPGSASMSGLMAGSHLTAPTAMTAGTGTMTALGGGGTTLTIGQMILQGVRADDPRAFVDDFNRQLLAALRAAKETI